MKMFAKKAPAGRNRTELHRQRRRKSRQLNEFIGECASLNLETIDARGWLVETLCRLLAVKLAGLLFLQESNTELVVFQEGHAEIQLDYPADFPQEGGLVEGCLASCSAVMTNSPQELAGRLFEPLSACTRGACCACRWCTANEL
jgi:hypothetical protein